MNKQFKQLIPYIKPYLPMTLLSILLTLPAGALDAVIVMTLKPYMDVIMLNSRCFGCSYCYDIKTVYGCHYVE